MGQRRFTAFKRSAAALALVVATPALSPTLHVRHLELDPLAWMPVLVTGIDADLLLIDLATAGVLLAADGLDSGDVTIPANEERGLDDGAGALTLALGGSDPSAHALAAGGGASNAGAGTGGSHDGMSPAGLGHGVASGGSPAGSTAPTAFEDTGPEIATFGTNARYVGVGPGRAPPGLVPFFQPQPGSEGVGPGGHPVVIATGPNAIFKGDDDPIPDPVLDDLTIPGNDGPSGPPSYEWPPFQEGPPGFAPTGFTPLEDVRVTASAVPEPGTLTLLALGLAGLALSRRKR